MITSRITIRRRTENGWKIAIAMVKSSDILSVLFAGQRLFAVVPEKGKTALNCLSRLG